MTTFYWHKAYPGLYYLWGKPRDKRTGPEFVAKCQLRGGGRSYLNTIRLDDAPSPTG